MTRPVPSFAGQRPSRAVAAVLGLGLLAMPAVRAEQQLRVGNAGTLTATARLNFNITIAKYVMLRVGNADASVARVTLTVRPDPDVTPGNARPFAGTRPPALVATPTSTQPTGAGTLAVAAFTNVAGTTLTCSLSPLAGTTAFVTGATAGGVPGTGDISVGSGGAGTLQHPGTGLAACNGTTSTAIASLTALSGNFTYGATFAPASLAAGTYGVTVTYTATTL